MDFVDQKNCLLCGNPGSSLHRNLKYSLPRCDGETEILRCDNCGHCWTAAIPKHDEIAQLYDNYFTHTNEYRSRGMMFFDAVIQQQYAPQPGLSLPRRLAFQAGAVLIPQKLRQNYVRYLSRAEQKPLRLLDVGCGNGNFLRVAAMLGMECYGQDFDAGAVESAKRKLGDSCRFWSGDLASSPWSDGYFDCIVLNHVIEHVDTPRDLLKQVGRLLKTDGQLIVTTPNSDGFLAKQYGKAWSGWHEPFHFHIYNLPGLTKLIDGTGDFTVESGSSPAGLMSAFAYVHSYYRQYQQQYGKLPPRLLRHLKMWQARLLLFFWGYGSADTGFEELVIIARKK